MLYLSAGFVKIKIKPFLLLKDTPGWYDTLLKIKGAHGNVG